ncbi:hypothetical protein [Mangrovimonas sp. YM274]|uniref:hypothetical protein n=1 Tax=Mangrovimonas sp. YM274 TaxID=3070660 RepID=UPI0027DB6106|nr:hypothetical protein [Mangrovimonas sp. YM274]WMI69363.1 hypothetical protein RBH95_03065 [Mangrovimonas sp. YM274]
MNKLTLLLVSALFFSVASVFGQARSELNFGFVGANYEIPIHRDITIAPGAGTSLDFDWLNLGVKGNYYFDNLFGLTAPAWDVYGGANLGYSVYMGSGHDDSDIDFGLQIGGRWFWNDKWGIYAEIAGGNVSGLSPGIGLTVKL